MAAFVDVAISPLGLVLDELNRRAYSLDYPPTDEVFDAVAAELNERPAAEPELARAVRRFGGS